MQPNHYHVTVMKKGPSHPQFGVGHDMAFAVNGRVGKDIVLERGQTYYFDVDTNVKHDFYFSTNSVGWGSGVYTDGIKGQFTYKGVVTFKPSANAPSTLYYQCRNHKAMGWKIHLINKGESAKITKTGQVMPKPQSKRPVPGKQQIQQKIKYAHILLTQSSAAKRIHASSDQKAKDMLNDATTKLAKSKRALAANQLAKAQAAVNDALRTVSAASRQVPARRTPPVEEMQEKFDEYMTGLKTFRSSYERTVKRARQDKKGQSVTVKVDLAQVDSMIAEANSLRASGKLHEANQLLGSAQHKLTSALNKMLASQTVVYDLKFDSAKDEYDYEVARYESYRELIPLAIERKRPNDDVIKLMNQFEKKAQSIFEKAQGFAKKGEYKTAVEGTREATKSLRGALRLVGV